MRRCHISSPPARNAMARVEGSGMTSTCSESKKNPEVLLSIVADTTVLPAPSKTFPLTQYGTPHQA